MRVTADTNVLLRAVMDDDALQSPVAKAKLEAADSIAIATAALCEFVCVLAQGYRVPTADIGDAILRLVNSEKVVANRPAVDSGLSMLEAGGDFADGVIAFEGSWLGAESFVTFDKSAAKLIESRGGTVRLLG